MRTNLPITNTQYELRDDSSIVSKTDIKGIITYVNLDFVEASGIGEGMNGLMQTCASSLDEVVRVLGALAKSDLTETITNEYHGTFGQLKDDSNTTVAQLTGVIKQIKEAVDTINTAAKEIAHGNAELSQRTVEQSASLEETATK